MAAFDVSELLRPGLLEGVRLALAPESEAGAHLSLAEAVRDTCMGLGAEVLGLRTPAAGTPEEQEAILDGAVAAITAAGPIDMLVVDADAVQRAEGHDGRTALVSAAETSWAFTRAVAAHALIPAERGGRIVYLAPAPGSEHAGAACAALENLARTLSIEWSRHQITTVTVAPGIQTSAREVAALVAYLASPAGAYFSGCLLDLRGPAG